jgi:hypothetical protein
MNDMFRKLVPILVFAGFCSGQSLTPDEAIDDGIPRGPIWMFGLGVLLPRSMPHCRRLRAIQEIGLGAVRR